MTTLYSIRLSTLYQLYLECENNITGNKDKRFLRIILDVCCRRLFQPVRSNNCVPKPRPRHFIKIHFHNKGIDKVNLHNMLHNKLVNSKVPIYFKEKEPPVISYKYTDNISRKVFNYNQTLSDVNLSKYGNWNQSCDCKSSTFCYGPHGHIITGDLRSVKNRKLRRLLSKGPKYREENTIDWDLNKNILITAVDDYAKNWSKREGVPVSVLNEWSLTLKLIISNKINSLKKTKVKKFMQVLKDKHVVSYFKDLHSKYVIVPADKAGNNIIFVCKYLRYTDELGIDVLRYIDELGIDSTGNANGNYEAQHDTPDEVIKKHSETIEKEFKIKLTDEEEKLPQMYWIPKLHKKPYKARFIAGSSSCTTTRLSKLITSCLKLVKSHCISYCKTIYDRTGVNAMWIINNSLDVIQMIGRKQFQATSVTTWDFSTLYTSIPHEKLKHRIHELLEKTYAVRRKSFIATDNFRTFWTDEKKCNR